MRSFLLLLALALSATLATAPLAGAQEDVDVDAIAGTVLETDQDALMTALETPVPDEDLPEGFSNASRVDPESATGQEGVIPASDLKGAEGSVAYAVDFDPAAREGVGTPGASPEADAFTIGLASLNYIFMDDEITQEDLEDFKAGAEEGFDEETGAGSGGEIVDATVEDIQVGGEDGALITYLLDEEGIQSVVQMVALPVGNTMVLALVVQAGAEVDADAVLAAAEDLALAGTDYLGTVAEDVE